MFAWCCVGGLRQIPHHVLLQYMWQDKDIKVYSDVVLCASVELGLPKITRRHEVLQSHSPPF